MTVTENLPLMALIKKTRRILWTLLLQRNFFRAFWVSATLVLIAGLLHTGVKAIDSAGPALALIIFPIVVGLLITVYNRPSDGNVVRLLDKLLGTKSLFVSTLDGLKSNDQQKTEGYELVIRNANLCAEKSIDKVSADIESYRPRWAWIPGVKILTGILLLQLPGANTFVSHPDHRSDGGPEILLGSPIKTINFQINNSNFESVTSSPDYQDLAKSGKNAGENSGLGKNENKAKSSEIEGSEAELYRKQVPAVHSDIKSNAASKLIEKSAIDNSVTNEYASTLSGLGDAKTIPGLSQSQEINLNVSFTDIYRKGKNAKNSGSFGDLEFEQIKPNPVQQLDDIVADYSTTGESGNIVSYNSFTLSQKKIIRDYYKLLGTKL